MGEISADHPDEIRRMFARIARRYDLNNRLHSLWLDQRWRRRAVGAAELAGGERVLDVACGTGDLAGLFRRAGAGAVVGVDFCEEMLAVARRRLRGRGIEWLLADATALPVPDASFDVVSIAFGLRNIADRSAALAEFARVLRPGGRLVVLEFDRPRSGAIAAAVRFYLDRVMPRTAAAIAAERGGAYDYLHRSVRAFPPAQAIARELRRAGFAEVTTRRLTFGIAALHRGQRP